MWDQLLIILPVDLLCGHLVELHGQGQQPDGVAGEGLVAELRRPVHVLRSPEIESSRNRIWNYYRSDPLVELLHQPLCLVQHGNLNLMDSNVVKIRV